MMTMPRDVLEKFLFDSSVYLGQTQLPAASSLPPLQALARQEGTRCLPQRVPSTSNPGQARKLAQAFLLAVTLATTAGCAATPTRESTGQFLDDSVVTAKVKAAILDQPTLKTLEIKVTTVRGTVYLHGIVARQATIDEASRVARSVAGVKSVKNEMRLM